MAIWYSAETRGFYHDRVSKPPPGAVAVTESVYAALLLAQEKGGRIQLGPDGKPTAVMPPAPAGPPPVPLSARVAALEATVATLEAAVAAIQAQLAPKK